MDKKELIKFIVIAVGGLLVLFGGMAYLLTPSLSDFRNSIYGDIITFSVIGGIILFVTLSKNIDMPMLGKVTVWGFLGVLLLSAILNLGKIEALFLFIYSIINVAVAIYLYKTTGKEYKSIWLFGAFSYLSTATIALRAEFVQDDWWLTIVIPAIVVAVIVFIPCLIYGIEQCKYRDWDKGIGIPLLGLLGGFLLSFLTISSMNVYLDFSTPTYENFVIIDKDVDAGSRQITTYELKVQNGEVDFWLDVSEETYYNYEINDTITLSIYNGAFNEPYYIYDKNAVEE